MVTSALRTVCGGVDEVQGGPGIMPLPEHSQIDQHRILREIGRGAMGVVYEAEEIPTGRHVALKVLASSIAANPSLLGRFEREVRTTANLDHPGIVKVYTVGTAGEPAYYTMEYVRGISLAEFIACPHYYFPKLTDGSVTARSSTLAAVPEIGTTEVVGSRSDARTVLMPECDPKAEGDGGKAPEGGDREPLRAVLRNSDYMRFVARAARDAAAALAYAHVNGVVHRDVKPANILLSGDGQVRVTDFGLAMEEGGVTLTQPGQVVGTPRYMSPEQLLGSNIRLDARTDIYSLGATLYEMLTLQPVFKAQTQGELLLKITVEDPPFPRHVNPHVPRDLEIITVKAMEKNPAHRYASAQQLAEDLTRFLRNEPIQAFPPTMVTRLSKFARRHRALTAALCAAVFFAIVGVVLTSIVQYRKRVAWVEAKTTEAALLAEEYSKAVQALGQVRPEREQVWRDLHGVYPGTDNSDMPALEQAYDELEEREATEELRASASLSAAVSLLHQALSAMPHHAGARAALAELYLDALLAAEREGNDRDVAMYHELAVLYDDGRLAGILDGAGLLTVTTAPEGATVRVMRHIPKGKRLVPEATGTVGTSPLTVDSIAMGSYLLVLEKRGYRPVTYPVLVTRSRSISVDIPLFTEAQLGPDMVYIPAGESILGSDPDAEWPLPSGQVHIPGFLIGRKEVTCREYLTFLNALARTDPQRAADHVPRANRDRSTTPWPCTEDGRYECPVDPDWPVLGISWLDAIAYCDWLSHETGRRYRLPRVAEWERAARGADGRYFPWGNRPSPRYANASNRWKQQSVGARPEPSAPDTQDRSPFGVLDMGGNAWELCMDEFEDGSMTVKGGCWYRPYDRGRLASRWRVHRATADRGLGFRVACDLPRSY